MYMSFSHQAESVQIINEDNLSALCRTESANIMNCDGTQLMIRYVSDSADGERRWMEGEGGKMRRKK